MSDCSPAVRALAANATSSATQKTYATVIRRYEKYCASRSPPWDAVPSLLTPASIAEFAADLAGNGELAARTVRVYLSGLSSWWKSSLVEGADPFASPQLRRVLDGIDRQLNDAALTRDTAAPCPALTPSLLLQLEPALRACATPLSRLMLAAANLGVHTALRPNEILGSSTLPDRAPLASSLVFYRRAHSLEIARVGEGAVSSVPDRFSIYLGATKTDQAGRNAPKPCAVPSAVRALWEWCHLRYARAESSPLLFVLDGAPLLMKDLLAELSAVHEQQGFGPVRFTGKCFRRGGISEAAAEGASTADLQARGGWQGAHMPAIYTTAEAKEQRILARGRAVPSRLQ